MINFKKIIGEKIAKAAEIEEAEVTSYIEIPPNTDLGDYAFPCFRLAKTLKKAPPMIAEELKQEIYNWIPNKPKNWREGQAVFNYIDEMYGGCVNAKDLRAGAALIVAAMGIKEQVEIEDTHHIIRGYENIVQKFEALGADIKII